MRRIYDQPLSGAISVPEMITTGPTQAPTLLELTDRENGGTFEPRPVEPELIPGYQIVRWSQAVIGIA